MAIRPPWAEAEVVGPEQAAELVGQLLNLVRHGPVGKAKPLNPRGTTTQPIEGNPRLIGTRRCEIASQSTRSGVGSLTIGNGHHHRFDTDATHVLEQASGPEDLVIGVRGHDNEPTGSPLVQWTERGKFSRPEPGCLVCSRMQVVDD
jgi:hypothetical protein